MSLADQHASIYDSTGLVTRTRVSTGQAGHRTPTGVFSVIGKERWHRSNIYSGAPMPFMQRITWSGVAMHAGVVPGYPASHGCIRLPAGFAPQLFGMTKMGARVIVTPRDVAPVEFTHTLLPLPKMQPAPAMPAGAQQAAAPAERRRRARQHGNADVDHDHRRGARGGRSAGRAGHAAQPDRLRRRAQEARRRRQDHRRPSRQGCPRRCPDCRRRSAPGRRGHAQGGGRRDGRAGDDRCHRRAYRRPRCPAGCSHTRGDRARPVEADKAAAQSELARAQSALEEARARDAAKSPAAFNAVEAWKRAVAASEAAADLVGEASRRGEQVSVFISRKEGRIFIRQDWKDVWEAPITFRDPDRPIGTHVYTAVEAAPDGASMRWTAMSMPPEAQSAEARSRGAKDKPAQSEAAVATPETAAGALDRIELPEGARERIAELLWTGGSLIVSDNPRSYEMSDNETDFIVLTR